MEFSNAVCSFFKNYAVFSGRANRSEYWYSILFCTLVGFALGLVEEIGGLYPYEDESLLANLFNIIILVPSLSVFFRRMHDVGRSGWWYMLIFTVIGAIPVFIWLCRKGTDGPNKYD